ncbi:MAG: insulinase family protein [Calditrichaeota bacterium]|nr:insulinase family protein [Calditrichota bacterium]HQU71806.1 pitrilysin family protein [Calditrichia bacterium]
MTKKEAAARGRQNIRRHRLENGLEVLLLPGSYAPLVAVDIWYRVGSRNETPGKSGFAHLFEHMMFQGSANVGKAEHMKLITDVGGSVNASTSKERTNYYAVVPKNQLPLALWLEADRMRSLAVTRENFENELAAVKEERRLRVDNAPYGPVMFELLDELFYREWPYKHSLIGSMADLNQATFEDITAFHERFYRPANAILALAGDFDPEATLQLIETYFGDIPAGEAPPHADFHESPRREEARMEVADRFAPLPAIAQAYHIPPYGHADYPAIELLEKILFDGESARMNRRLIEKEQTALHLFGGSDGKMGPGMFQIFAQLNPNVSPQQLEASIAEEIDRVCREDISENELLKTGNQMRADLVSRMEQVLNQAEMMCLYTMAFDDPGRLFEEEESYQKVTAADIRRVANQYLRPENRVVIHVMPGNGE